MWIRSATSNTCGMLWLMRITGMPRSRRFRTSSSTWFDSRTPSAAVGSSSTTTFDPNAAARATATAWRCPPDRFSTGTVTSCSVEMPSSVSSARASRRMPAVSSMRKTDPRIPFFLFSRPR